MVPLIPDSGAQSVRPPLFFSYGPSQAMQKKLLLDLVSMLKIFVWKVGGRARLTAPTLT